jgi:phage-related protein
VRHGQENLETKSLGGRYPAVILPRPRQNGLAAARHLRGEVYEVRAETERQSFRNLFAQETTFILLSLSGFQKKRAKTPADEIVLAESRLAEWRRRGRARWA